MRNISLWTERWFLSCNAKDIGTLYLIFALFSGLVGTAFSVLVRLCAIVMLECLTLLHFTPIMLIPSGLGKGESSLLNLASLWKGKKSWNSVSDHFRGIVSMVKSILIEFYLVVASRKGLSLADYRTYHRMSALWVRAGISERLGRVMRNNKPKSGEPKGTAGITMELGDCLREGAKTSYGNRALVVPRGLLWERRAGLNLKNPMRDSLGYRGYSTNSKREVDTELPKKFLKLAEQCSKDPDRIVPDNLLALLRIPEMYQIAYSKLKSNPGNMTPGITPETLDGISMEWVTETIAKISNQSFNFSPGRRVLIPKANGKMRPLTVAPPRDKIVQEVLRMILEAVFEPTFSENSHGFRPARSCHTALKQVRSQFGAASYYLEGDISKCFDSFDHHILMNLIESKIKDRRFTALIWKALQAGYCEFHEVKSAIVGTPQGSIISPILANIYLTPLDRFMENRIAGYDRGVRPRIPSKYKSLDYYQSKAAKSGDTQEALRLLKLKQTLPGRVHADPDFRRMYYVRYADDWIVAIRGPRADVVRLSEEVKNFLEHDLKLELSLEKTQITVPREEPALFLGTKISISSHTYSRKGRRGQHLRSVSQIRMLAPIHRIYKKLRTVGFIGDGNKGIPRFLWKDLNKDTIVVLYNSVLRGYLNYYSFTHNYNHLAASLTHLLKGSCMKLLAAKFELQTCSKVMKKYGTDLKGEDKAAFLNPPLKLKVWDFKTNAKEYIKTLYASHLSAASLANLTCKKCGTEENVEMHHIRKLSDLNPKLSEVDRIMIRARRKQVPLCRQCHLEHHKINTPWGGRNSKRTR